MKERPIPFSAPMVRAILEGRKTQTRQVVKNAHIITCDDRSGATDTRCPFGVPGDRHRIDAQFFPVIVIEIVNVRVERLQEISEADAQAEGVEKNTGQGHKWSPDDGYRTYCSHYPNGCECFPHDNARNAYADLWDKINGEGSWDANPWVWVVEFGVVKPETAGGQR